MSMNKSDDTSLSSMTDMNETNKSNLNQQLQRYSITCHPIYPVLVCSDGFLMCVLKINSAYSTQPRLIREFMNESISLLNSLGDKPINVMKYDKLEEAEPMPEWGINTGNTQQQVSGQESGGGSASDSGLDSNEKGSMEAGYRRKSSLSASQSKIAEGKIIFSFLPQIIPISTETINESVATRIESVFESMQNAWALLASMNTTRAILDTAENDRTAKSILFLFARFSRLLLGLDPDDLSSLNVFKNGMN